MMEPQGRILDGNLDTLGLQSTLKMLALGGKTGILTVTSGNERIAVHLENGQIVDLDEPGAAAPDLIDMFRLLRRIARPQSQELRRLAGANPATAMAIMVNWGMMDPAEHQRRTEFRVIQAVSRAVRWERGRFEFHRDVSAFSARVSPHKPFNVDHVLLESLRIADESGRAGGMNFSRGMVARWMQDPEFKGDITGLGLSPEEIKVLCLSNGQFPLSAIAYALMVWEAEIAQMMQRLLDLGLIEVVDARLETELERSLVNLLTQSQYQLSQNSKLNPEQRMILLIRTMGNSINGLLAHHAIYARALRGRGEVPQGDVTRYLDNTFGQLLYRLQREYPRMDGIVSFANGSLDFHEVESLDTVVRGQELAECLWDAVCLFSQLMRAVFERVIQDEVGKSRVGRQFEDLWTAFFRETDEEINRHFHRRAAARVPADRPAQMRGGMAMDSRAAYAYELAPDPQRRFN
jgi:hypothetical protein